MTVWRLANVHLGSTLICLLLTGQLRAQFPTIEVTSISPVAIQRESDAEISLHGNLIDELDHAFVSGGGFQTEIVHQPAGLLDEPGESHHKFSVTTSNAAGVYSVRVHGRFGLSNARPLLVTDQPIELLPDGQHDPGLAAELQTGRIYTGQFEPQKRKYFHFSLSAGELLDVRVYASQLDSRAIPVLVVRDASGREVDRSRGMKGWPAEVHVTASRDQDYMVEVHDFLYQGGIDYAFVLEASRGNQGEATGDSSELDRLLRPSVTRTRSINLAAAALHTFTSIELLGQDVEQAPPAPCGFYGSLQSRLAHHNFVAQKGQTFWIEVQSALLDQLTDPNLIVYKVNSTEDGQEQLQQLAFQDDRGTVGGPAMRIRYRDPSLKWTAPEDATYRIVLSDNEAGKRPADSANYRVWVRPEQPGFALLAMHAYPNLNRELSKPFGLNLMRGGTELVRVIALRHDGFNEAIEVSIPNLPASISCPAVVIPANQTEATLIIQASEDANFWSDTISVVGHSMADPQKTEVKAAASRIAYGKHPLRNSIQARLSNDLRLSINHHDTAPLVVELGDGTTVEAKAGSKLSLPIQVTRRDQGKVASTLKAQNLPPKTSLGDVKIAADKDEATAELNIAGDAVPGEYTFWMLGETKIKWRQNPQAEQRATDYLQRLEAALKSASEAEKEKLNAAITAQKARLETLKKANAEKEIAVWLPTTSARIRILQAENK